MEFVQKNSTSHTDTSEMMHKETHAENLGISIKNASIGLLYKKRVFLARYFSFWKYFFLEQESRILKRSLPLMLRWFSFYHY